MVGKYIISFIDVDSAIYTDRSKDDRVASVVVCGQQVASLRLQLSNSIFSSTFRRKKVKLLSSLGRQRLGWLSFLSESISQKLSKGIHLKLVHY
jgi:hypothetical protein